MGLEQLWGRKSDEEVLAAARQLDTYTSEGQRAIHDEMQRRGLSLDADAEAPSSIRATVNAPRRARVGWFARLFSRPKCQKCGTSLKSRSELAGTRMGGGIVDGAALEAVLEATMKAAYQCRECGYRVCRVCVPEAGGCPECGGPAFDSV